MKLKVCGMKYPENMAETALLQPDFMGFIFWDKSPRYFGSQLPQLPRTIKKVGVFVDACEDEIRQKIKKYGLDLIQLHGSESAGFCSEFSSDGVEIIKAFSVDESFDFGTLSGYEAVCDYFLFDTKGKSPGGNGEVFDWQLLEKYNGTKPIFLSGGISPESAQNLKKLRFPVFAIDINSRFESEPGRKDITKIAQFKNSLK